MRKPSAKRAIATILVLAITITTLFASSLTPRTSFGDAKVYDRNYKAVRDAKAIEEGFTIRTGANSVFLVDGETHVGIDANSLVVFLGLDPNLTIYVLDGKVHATSKAGDFTVMTTVTSYTAKAGSSIYVISDAKQEVGYNDGGSLMVKNYITGTTTEMNGGSYIDNSVIGFTPKASSLSVVWGSTAPEAEKPAPQPEPQPEVKAEPETKQELKVALVPLSHTFNLFNGYTATFTAYKGYGILTYPAFITDQEIAAAAQAAFNAYPQYMEGIYYRFAEPGNVVLTYPESYGVDEFNFAVSILEEVLPPYLTSVLAQQQAQQQAQEQAQQPVQTQTAEPVPAAPAEPTPVEKPETETKTPLETTPRPEEEQVAKKEPDFRFGATVGAVYGMGKNGNEFYQFPYTDGRVGTFYKNASFIVGPYIKYKNFTLGLLGEVKLIDGQFNFDFFKIDTEHGKTGYVNSIAKFFSVIQLDGEKFGFSARLNSDYEISSPLFNAYDWRYDRDNSLVGKLYFKTGVFSLDAFVDDIKLTNRLNSKSQFAGIRAGVTFGGMKAGFSVVADFGSALKQTRFYPSLDLTIPFTIAGTKFNFDITGAAQISIENGFKLQGVMGQGIVSVGYGPVYLGFGGAYNHGTHFNDQITNSPVTVLYFTEGNSIDAIFKAKIDTKIFDLGLSFRIPFKTEGGLFTNFMKTRNGLPKNMTADVFDLEMKFDVKGFSFILGGSSYGFAGHFKSLIKAIGDKESFKAALLNIVNPQTSTIFTELDFKMNFGSTTLDVFLRGDVAEVDGRMRIPVSLGATFTF